MPLMSQVNRVIVGVIASTLLAIAFATYWFGIRTTASTDVGGTLESAGAISQPELRDIWGNRRTLEDVAVKRTSVVAFLGVDCAASQRVLPKLKQLASRYHPGDVAFVAVYSAPQDNLERAAGHACDNNLPCTVLVDLQAGLARQLRIRVTPSIAIFDKSGELRFSSGMLADRHDVPPTPEDEVDLARAIDAALGQGKYPVAIVEASGTPVQPAPDVATDSSVTYAEHVAPILQARCQSCHRPGTTAPFALVDYDDAVRWSAMIREVVSQRRMPPWHADPRHGSFSNSRRLTQNEVETIVAWVDDEMPQGDLRKLPPPRTWNDGWSMGEPHHVVDVPQGLTVPAEGVIPYEYIHLDRAALGDLFDQERWVTAAEIRPSEPSVVHHMAAYIVPPGESPDIRGGLPTPLATWTPGSPEVTYPAKTGQQIVPGSTLLLEVHHTANGKIATNHLSLGLRFADRPPEREILQARLELRDFRIPPRQPHHVGEASLVVDRDALLHGMIPHMHFRGKDVVVRARFPDGREETLLMVPRYDFNWQTRYQLQSPLSVPAGTRLSYVAHWDNSAGNRHNPDSSVTVSYGQQSTDEMQGVGLYLSAPRGSQAVESTVSTGAGTEAIPHDLTRLRQKVADEPANVAAHLELAAALSSQKDLAGGRAQYAAALELQPTNHLAIQGLAALDMEQGDLASAEKHLRRAIEISPDEYGLWNDLGVLLVRTGRAAEAESCYRQAIACAPQLAMPHANLVYALIQLDRLAEAETAARSAIERDPQLADGHLSLGIALTRLKRYDEALVALERAASLRPGHAPTILAKGSLAYEQGDLDRALAHFDEALNLHPQFAEARLNRGLALARRGEVDRALSDFEAAARQQPELAEAHFYAGICRVQLHDAQGAIDGYRRAIELRPNWRAARNNLAWILATHPDNKFRDGAEARSLCTLGNEPSESSDFATLDTLAAAQAAADQFTEAVATLQKAIQLAQDKVSPDVIDQMQERLKLYESGKPFRDFDAW